MSRHLALIAACLVPGGCGAAVTGNVTPAPHPRSRVIAGVTIGASAGGRPLTFSVSGTSGGPRALVVGCIHGDECAGMAVTRRLLRGRPPVRGALWVIGDLDPDGRAAGTRLNGHGVDLNRNFPTGWRSIGRPGDLQYPGPHPFSEPETRAVRRLVRGGDVGVTIWFHQQAEALVRAWGQSVPVARRYARLVGLPFRRMRWLAGTAPHWQNTAFPHVSSFVVELPPGPLGAAAARRHARAVLAVSGLRLAPRGRRR